jgi:pyruvate carboxylase
LKEQARSLGIDDAHWPEVARAYAQESEMFGDIIKVTPSSKVVGDMAIFMVTSGLTPEMVLDPNHEVAFPESVVSFFKGDLGQPHGGFPPALQKKILNGVMPLTTRPGESLPAVNLDDVRVQMQSHVTRPLNEYDLCSYLMYPKVFLAYLKDRDDYGPVSGIPTRYFFYGMEPGDELTVDIERGKSLIIRFVAMSDAHDDGTRTVFFELNGEPRSLKIADRSKVAAKPPRRKAEAGNDKHIAAPMPGTVSVVHVHPKVKVVKGDVLVTIEAMKMETAVRAERDGEVLEVLTRISEPVDAKDLLVVMT